MCGAHVRRFLPYGLQVRPHAMCLCESVERHRLYWLFYRERTDLATGRHRMLHLAPEMGLETRLARPPALRRVTADLVSPYVDVRGDLLDLPFGDGAFDVLHCSHVLEHVADDQRALRELRRVLAPAGWALIQVPVWTDGPTEEDPSVTDPGERERRYGQHDHVRLYGPDVVDRIRAAGFVVDVIPAAQIVPAQQLARMAIPAAEEIFHCRPAPG